MKKTIYKINNLGKNVKALQNRLSKELTSQLVSKGGPVRMRKIGFEAVDQKGKMVGGIFGFTYWNCLIVDSLWVDKKYRKRGIGKSLIQLAETEGRKKGCNFAYLNSSSLQTPAF